ncbi:phosphatidylinositol-binding protein scs2 [Rhizophlyctis rosea]|nr:phosphatidylinositol-binding protein scs2 [Rhizophlyctis rosea]
MDSGHSLVADGDRELKLRPPFTQSQKHTLTVRNVNTKAVLHFKVKTTSPNLYCVRPNSGLLAPNTSAKVDIILQALAEDPPSKDKFLVQAIKVSRDMLKLPEDKYRDRVSDLWTQAELVQQSGANMVEEVRLRAVYLLAETRPAGAPVTNSITPKPSAPPHDHHPAIDANDTPPPYSMAPFLTEDAPPTTVRPVVPSRPPVPSVPGGLLEHRS